MTVRSTSLWLALAIAALPLALTGCGGATPATPTASQKTAEGTAPTATGPTSTTTVMDGAGTEPAQSVAIFLDSLRRGDETAANAVLTAKARTEMAKTSYVLQPLGSPEGQFKIGRIGFPYEDKTVALVECLWTEPATKTEASASMDIVCEVHQEVEGWRISGIGVTMTGTEDALVLDFEDAVSLQNTIDEATGQSTTTGTVAGSTLTADGMPALPSFPEGTSTNVASPAGNTQQIAMPPLDGAPVLR